MTFRHPPTVVRPDDGGAVSLRFAFRTGSEWVVTFS